MVKIPTFTAKGEMTTDIGVTKTGVQIPLTSTISTALAPISKAVANHAIKEKNFENKTEALKLENEALLQLVDVFEEAGQKDNKEIAFDIIKNKSEIIKNNFSNKASNKHVETMFNNNFYAEVQKGIFKVNSRVSTNIIQSLDQQVTTKKNRLLTDAYLNDNPLAFKLIGSELEKLYEENYKGRIDDDEYNQLISNIPSELQVFEVNQLITKDPLSAIERLRDPEQFKDLQLEDRISLEREALLSYRPILKDNMTNYLVALENGEQIPLDQNAVKEIFGNTAYEDFKQTEKNIINFSSYKINLFNSKIGNEKSIVDSFPLTDENYAEDLKYKQKLINLLSKKDELIKNDAATLILTFNKEVRSAYDDFNNETDETIKSQKFSKYINMVYQAQVDMNIDSDLIKIIPNSQAANIVKDYNSRSAIEKIGYLQGLEEQYGEYYGKVLMQLSENGLPVTAKLVSYFNDEKFALSSLSIDTKEEKDILKNFLKGTDTTFSEVQKSVSDEIEEFREKVLLGNPFNTSKANQELDQITEVLTYMAINEMSRGTDLNDAVGFATDFINNNFIIEDTYFIPRIYNNENLGSGQIEFVAKKANIIKNHYLEAFEMETFRSTNSEVPEEELNSSMIEQAKDNGVWLNTADGNGLVFAIKFFDGTYGLIQNKEGKLLRFDFDDDSFVLPGTDIFMDKLTKKKEDDPQP
tara:strand:+ start:461 stop:2548 length:2088 start_codon:yes stop_codon:yes gene_type:complete